jgi:hypothetical protein
LDYKLEFRGSWFGIIYALLAFEQHAQAGDARSSNVRSSKSLARQCQYHFHRYVDIPVAIRQKIHRREAGRKEL